MSPPGPEPDRLLAVETDPAPRPRPGKVLVSCADGLHLPAQALPCKHLLLQGLLELPQRHLGLLGLRRGRSGLRSRRFSLRGRTAVRATVAPAAPKTRAQALGALPCPLDLWESSQLLR